MTFPAWDAVILAIGAAAFAANNEVITSGSAKHSQLKSVKRGDDVIIIAQRRSELDIAAQEKDVHKVHRDRRIVSVSADVTEYQDVVRAFDEAKLHMGRGPEIICCCAGVLIPVFQGLDASYRMITTGFVGSATRGINTSSSYILDLISEHS
ncbi:hypothetical protein BX666DRAFT_2027337 [Dichotomocladium elegans]|nr:hypothetical protein BX666DRAFT_2027337 [Dichotomocladium elegans]